ncbi:MAG: tetratricopeptide repeat protein [Omnitrophica WOR_2 bacterium]
MNEALNPEELAAEGKVAYQNKKYTEAAQVFQAAQNAYMAKGDTIQAGEMANNRSVALLQGGDAQAALLAVEGTDIIFASAGDRRRQAMALGNRAAALGKLGRTGEAIADYEQAADLFQQIGEHDLRSSVLKSISNLQLLTGRPLESIGMAQAGLSEIEKPNLVQRLLKKFIQIPLRWLLRS